jgi:hypothetical protein
MGTLNHLPPITESHHVTIPAQPGWFMIDWQGNPEEPEVTKSPIVAWVVETEFYPRSDYSEKHKKIVKTMYQDRFSVSYPVWIGGAEHDVENGCAQGPDGHVYQLQDMGLSWPDIPTWVKWDEERLVAREEADKRKPQTAARMQTVTENNER